MLKEQPDNSADLVITSPPYADKRASTYETVTAEKYSEWFLPKAEQIRRVLKPDGSFILNIKERVINGERSTYVLELVLALKRQGWLWPETYLWHKKTAFPGYWPNRFRDAWEYCFQFTKSKTFRMYQDAVSQKPSEATIKRARSLSASDYNRNYSKNGSSLSRSQATANRTDKVNPSNVLYMAPVTGNVGHSAAFPLELPLFFIKLFSKEGDTVLDPFCGSGTTCIAAKMLNREYLGIDKNGTYVNLALNRLREPIKPIPVPVIEQPPMMITLDTFSH